MTLMFSIIANGLSIFQLKEGANKFVVSRGWEKLDPILAMSCSISDNGHYDDEDNLTLYFVFCISLFISFVLILEGIWLSLNSWNNQHFVYVVTQKSESLLSI